MKIDAALNPSEIGELKNRDLRGTACVVFDVLRATSSMITGLEHGVESFRPVRTIEEALELKGADPGFVLGGERHGERIEGFEAGNSPFEYQALGGRRVVTTTTNGTLALRACEGAGRVFVGSILNLEATFRAVERAGLGTVLMVCAGTFETLALEDVWAAGRLISWFEGVEKTDSALVAESVLARWPEPAGALMASRNGRALIAKGRGGEVDWCARESVFDIVAVMESNEVKRIVVK